MPPGELNNQGCIPPWEGLRALDSCSIPFPKDFIPHHLFQLCLCPWLLVSGSPTSCDKCILLNTDKAKIKCKFLNAAFPLTYPCHLYANASPLLPGFRGTRGPSDFALMPNLSVNNGSCVFEIRLHPSLFVHSVTQTPNA